MKRRIASADSKNKKAWKSYAERVTNDLLERRIFLNLGDASVDLAPAECIRAVSEQLPESAIRNLLLKCMVDAESSGAGGAFVVLSTIASLHDGKIEAGNRFTVQDLRRSLNELSDSFTSNIVVDSIELAGRNGKIIVDRNDSTRTEVVYGSQSCRWKPDLSFFSTLGRSSVSAQKCKMVFIDGIIESVSECHKLFQESYEKKIPVVIFARGFAEEVNATAAVNFQRGTAQVIPIVVPFDEIGVNSLGDLASSFNSEVISSDKGQLISNVSIDDNFTVDRIRATSEMTEIEASNTSIDHVVRSISNKMKSQDSISSDISRKRIEALGAGTVTIRVGAEKKSKSGIVRDRIDFGIRFAKDCIMSGVSNFGNLVLPRSSIIVGTKCAKSFLETIENCGAVLEVESCG